MPPRATKHIQTRRGDNVRIGPISVITLIIVVCMAVMSVLAASTSHATTVISQRQATATKNLYLNERAGQEFLAGIDDVLAGVRASGGTASDGAVAVQQNLDGVCERVRSATGGSVTCSAVQDGTVVKANFVCGGTRLLDVALTIQADVTYRIDEWKMASAQQDAQATGNLWMGS